MVTEKNMVDEHPLVEVENIGKSFGATVALNGVSFQFYSGEIFALVGANGAGKSTLIKIICGYYPDHKGEIRIRGQKVHFSSPVEASKHGIQTVHQIINQSIIPDMSIAENLALGEMLTAHSSFWYQRKAIRQKAKRIADQMKLSFKNLSIPVRELKQSDRQMIAIARALASNPKLLILDEPTSSISDKEATQLFTVLEDLKKMGVAIVYVSHRLHEIERIADRVGVIRDGVKGNTLKRPFTVRQIVSSMVDDISVEKRSQTGRQIQKNPIKLELRNLIIMHNSPPINLKVHQGEILGITGLIGAGKSELAQILFGLSPPYSGEILVDGEPLHLSGVRDAIQRGMFLVPEDRGANAVIPEFSIRHNITLPFTNFFSSRLGIMKNGMEQSEAERMIDSIGVKCSGESALISSLSGGNQQKVVVSRWVMKAYQVLILDEPFQGVDIKSRNDISAYLRQKSGNNATILMCADLDEIIDISDRVIVLNHGQIAGEQWDYQLERSQLLKWISQIENTYEEREHVL